MASIWTDFIDSIRRCCSRFKRQSTQKKQKIKQELNGLSPSPHSSINMHSQINNQYNLNQNYKTKNTQKNQTKLKNLKGCPEQQQKQQTEINNSLQQKVDPRVQDKTEQVPLFSMKKIQQSTTSFQQSIRSPLYQLIQSNFQASSSQKSTRNYVDQQQGHYKQLILSLQGKKIPCQNGQIQLVKKKYVNEKNKSSLFQTIYTQRVNNSGLIAKIFQKKQNSQQAKLCKIIKATSSSSKTNLIDILQCFQFNHQEEGKSIILEGILMPQGQKSLSKYLDQRVQGFSNQNQFKDYLSQVYFILYSILNGLKEMLNLDLLKSQDNSIIQKGFAHKDIKPQNVVMFFQEKDNKKIIKNIKIIDFGTACKVDQTNYKNHIKNQGTVYYKAPQLLIPKLLNESKLQVKKLDSFSLGMMLFQMLLSKDNTFFKQIKNRDNFFKENSIEQVKNLTQIYSNQKFYQRYKKKLIDLIPTMQLPQSLIFLCLRLLQLYKQNRFSIEQAHNLMTTQVFKKKIKNQFQKLKTSPKQSQASNQICTMMNEINENLLNQQQKTYFKFFLYLHIMTYYFCQKKNHKKNYQKLEKQLNLVKTSSTQISPQSQEMLQQRQQLQFLKQYQSKYIQYIMSYLSYSLLKNNIFFQQKNLNESWKNLYKYINKMKMVKNNRIEIQQNHIDFQIPQGMIPFFKKLFSLGKDMKEIELFQFQQVTKSYQEFNQQQTRQCLKNYLKKLIQLKQKKQCLSNQNQNKSLKNFSQLVLKSCKNNAKHYYQNNNSLTKIFQQNDKINLLRGQVLSFLLNFLQQRKSQ